MKYEGGKGQPGLVGFPGKGPWYIVAFTMGFEVNGNELSIGVTEVG